MASNNSYFPPELIKDLVLPDGTVALFKLWGTLFVCNTDEGTVSGYKLNDRILVTGVTENGK